MGILDNFKFESGIANKKEVSTTYQTTTQNTSTSSLTYSPVTDYSYNLILNSAGATQETKKESSAVPSTVLTPSVTASQSATTEQKQTSDLIGPALLIGGGVAVALSLGLFGGKKNE